MELGYLCNNCRERGTLVVGQSIGLEMLASEVGFELHGYGMASRVFYVVELFVRGGVEVYREGLSVV